MIFSLKAYNAKMSEFSEKLNKRIANADYKTDYKDILTEISEYQYTEMTKYLEEYKAKADTRAKEVICEMLEYAISKSVSGSSIVSNLTKDEAEAVDDILWDEVGDLLAEADIYEKKDGTWCLDCILCGNYVPEWDGWLDC